MQRLQGRPQCIRGGAGASARTVGAPRQAVLLPARPSRSSSSAPQQQQQQQRQQRPAVLCAAAPGSGPRSGPTGLDVQGMRPTSPGAWEIIRTALIEAGVKLLSPQEVAFAQQSGSHALIDVRPAGLYAQGRLDGAANVEYYRPIQGWSPWQVARRIGYAAFGVLNGTEVNPDFAAEVAAAVGGDKSRPVLLYCSQGGALEGGSAGAAKRGFQTRSLVAAYELVQSGFTSVAILKGGYFGWEAAGREVVGANDGGAGEEEEEGGAVAGN